MKNDFIHNNDLTTKMTKKIKLETETETYSDCDFQNVQIEICNTTLTSIQKRLETMHKKLCNIELQFKDKQSYNKKIYKD